MIWYNASKNIYQYEMVIVYWDVRKWYQENIRIKTAHLPEMSWISITQHVAASYTIQKFARNEFIMTSHGEEYKREIIISRHLRTLYGNEKKNRDKLNVWFLLFFHMIYCNVYVFNKRYMYRRSYNYIIRLFNWQTCNYIWYLR